MPYLEYKTRDGGSILVEVDKNEVQAKSQTDQPEPTTPPKDDPFERDPNATPVGLFGDSKKKVVETIEAVTDAAIVKAEKTFEDVIDSVRTNAEAFYNKIQDIDVAKRPDEVHVTFGLIVTGEVGVAAKAGIGAGYTVTMVWKNDTGDASQPPQQLWQQAGDDQAGDMPISSE
ncbi:CU044_2847 family protein [Anaerolineales bacterium HSG24]|nr:CU044_2847 family protein [Anaerolineales bacterium HSG24]